MYYWKNIRIRWGKRFGGIWLDLNFIKSDGILVDVKSLMMFFFGGNINIEGIRYFLGEVFLIDEDYGYSR